MDTVAAELAFDDDRLARWAASYQAGDRDALMADLEADLVSPSPHPLAAWAWTTVAAFDGGDPRARAASGPDALRAALGELPSLETAYGVEDDSVSLLRTHPDTPEHAPLGTYAILCWASSDVDDDVHEMRLAGTAAREWPHAFLPLWELVTFDTEPGRAEALKAATALGAEDRTFVEQASIRGALPADRLAAVDAWLEAHPLDPWAHRFRAAQLGSLERYEDAADEYATAFRAAPMFTGTDSLGEMLVRTGRVDEARTLATTEARIHDADPVDREVDAIVRLAAYERAAGERGAARTEVVSGLARFPDDWRLLVALARIETASGRKAPAADDWARVAALHPLSVSERSDWVSAMTSAGR